MLQSICINNFLLLKNINIDLHHKFNVITGESGAGKSMVLQAIRTGLGDKFPNNCVDCNISLTFEVSKEIKDEILKIDIPVKQQVVIRRTIGKNNRTKCFINEVLVNKDRLVWLAQKLIGEQAQGEQRLLLKSSSRIDLFDLSGSYKESLMNCHHTYINWHQLIKKLNKIENKDENIELLKFQINEFEENLENIKQYQSLSKKFKTINQAKETKDILDRCIQIIEDESKGISPAFAKIISLLNMPIITSLDTNIINLSYDASSITKEISDALAQLKDSISEEASEIDIINEKLSTIEKLANKYRVNPADLPNLYENKKNILNNYEDNLNLINDLEQKIIKAEQEFIETSKALTEIRKQHSLNFNLEVNSILNKLDVKGEFIATVDKTNLNSKGQDEINFWLKSSINDNPVKIEQAASGGELSRISLALLTLGKIADTLILDEVDAGLSGVTASYLGKMIQKLSEKTQIICITHLAQVATKANEHLYVKRNADIITSNVVVLEKKQKIHELARIIGGLDINKNTLAQAEDMLKLKD